MNQVYDYLFENIKDPKILEIYSSLQKQIDDANQEKEKWMLLHQEVSVELNAFKHKYSLMQLDFLNYVLHNYLEKTKKENQKSEI